MGFFLHWLLPYIISLKGLRLLSRRYRILPWASALLLPLRFTTFRRGWLCPYRYIFPPAAEKKAFKLSFLSGLAEPLGAILGYFLFMQFFNESMFGFTFAGVAGIMVYIALMNYLPTAEKYGEHHIAIYGLIAGMMVMAVSLLAVA